VSLVALTHVGTHRGLVNPVAAAGAVLADHPAIFVLDACQSIGQLRVDVGEIGCDIMTGTGRKFLRAPRGSGFLWARAEVAERIDPPGIDGPSAQWRSADDYALPRGARRFEAFETSAAIKVGFGVAIDYLLGLGIDAVQARVQSLAESLRGALAEVGGVSVLDGGHERSGIVTFTSERALPVDVHSALRIAGINTSVTGTASAQLDGAAGHPLQAVRASVHYYNTDDELARVVGVLRAL
jgi:selenocysteine lyase/cysteine desulfurase